MPSQRLPGSPRSKGKLASHHILLVPCVCLWLWLLWPCQEASGGWRGPSAWPAECCWAKHRSAASSVLCTPSIPSWLPKPPCLLIPLLFNRGVERCHQTGQVTGCDTLHLSDHLLWGGHSRTCHLRMTKSFFCHGKCILPTQLRAVETKAQAQGLAAVAE